MKKNRNTDRLGRDLEKIEREIEDELLTVAEEPEEDFDEDELELMDDEDLGEDELDDEDFDDEDLDDEDLDDEDLDDEDFDDEDFDDEEEAPKKKKKKNKGLIALLVVLILVLLAGAGLFFGTMTYNITFTPSELSVALGSSASLKPVFTPSFARNKNYTVTVSDNSVISFDGTSVTALKEGTAVITAQQNGKNYGTCTVTVTPLQVTEIRFNADASVAKVGRAFDPEPIALPEDATYPDIELSVSDETIASVEDGMVTPLKAGTVTVTATNPLSGVSASFELEILAVDPETITIDAPEQVELGTTAPVSVSFEPEDITDTDIIWVSSDPAVLSVENGLLVPHEPGAVQLTATHSTGKSATVGVEVVPVQGKSITITSKTGNSTIKLKKSDTLTATVYPAEAADKTITWSSSNDSIVTVNAKGKVTAKGGGDAVITATLKNGVSATYNVSVPPTKTKRKNGFVKAPTATADAYITVNANFNKNTAVYFHSEDEDSTKDFCIYCIAGKDVRLKVPAGTYSVTVTLGNTWYGDGAMFYNDAEYYAFKEPFTIRDAETIDLTRLQYMIKQVDTISKADFGK